MANNRQTGPRAASAAGATLANPNATPAERFAAGSALSQTHTANRTGSRAASAAGATLANSNATRAERSAAASALSQAAGKAAKK